MWIFRRIYNKIKERYFKHKYSEDLPEIMFDRRYKEYVHPTLVNGGVFSCVEDMLPYLITHKFVYEFTIMDKYNCHSSFNKVLMDAYNYGDMFEIPPECESDYSVQELKILRELAIIGEKDRKEYSAAHDYPYLTWNNDSGTFEAELTTEIEEIKEID